MSDRLSMWSQVMLATWLREARCPQCEAMNIKGCRPIVELSEDASAYCNTCGHSWMPARPTVEPV